MSRARGVSFGDMRNIVCLCQRHHGYFREQIDRLYWELTEEIIGQARWEWIKRVERDQSACYTLRIVATKKTLDFAQYGFDATGCPANAGAGGSSIWAV